MATRLQSLGRTFSLRVSDCREFHRRIRVQTQELSGRMSHCTVTLPALHSFLPSSYYSAERHGFPVTILSAKDRGTRAIFVS